MKKLNDKKQVVAQISAAARLYKKNLVGKHFLYVFDGRAIEVAYQAKGFRHLTGVDTGLDAMSFRTPERHRRHGHFRVLYAGKYHD